MGVCWQHWRWLALGLLCLGSVAWAQQTKLEDVRVLKKPDRTRVVFDLSAAVNPDVFLLQSPARLVVDLPHTIKSGPHDSEWSGEGLVKRLRTGVRAGYDLRVVLDLTTPEVRRASYTLPPKGKYGHRVIVDLYRHKKLLTLADVVNAAPEDTAAEASRHQERAVQVAAEVAAAANGADSTEPRRVAFTPIAPTRKIVVAVDAGHGGHDPGAIGPDGTKEKDVTLAMAQRLAAMIDSQPNMRAVMTRKKDIYVGLRERIVRSRKARADLFVSIHANASVDPDPHGVSVFALSLDGATSEHARLLAERENAAVSIGGISLEQKNPNVASFMLDLAQSATIEASLDVGRRVLRNLDALATLLRTRVEQAAFVVLKSPDTPSILVETGFISNPREERRLQSSAYQIQVAQAILRGIKGYFASYRPGTIIAEALVYTVEPGDTLSDIAMAYHVSVSRLREVNNLSGNMIRVGQKLRIPADNSPRQVASR